MNGADVVAAILKREGTEFLACYPRNPLIDACARIDIRPILCRQERVGVGMADGFSRIRRGKQVIFEQPFLTGEANMSHSIANLEAHHFKYEWFRRPGDVHVHTFGTATLSVAAGISTKAGDVFEIEAPGFGLPLVNPHAIGKQENIRVRRL